MLKVARAAALIVVVGLAVGSLVGCSSGKQKGDASASKRARATERRPKECGKDDKDPKARSKECAKALFNQKVDATATKTIEKMSDDRRIELARAVCQAVEEIPTDVAVPSKIDFMASMGEKLDVAPEDLDRLAAAAEPLCPEQFKIFDRLPPLSRPVTLDLSITGRGRMTITYTDNTGKTVSEDGFAPWQLPVTLDSPVNVVLKAEPQDKKASKKDGVDPKLLKCSIALDGGEIVSGAYDSGAGVVECRLDRDSLISEVSKGDDGVG